MSNNEENTEQPKRMNYREATEYWGLRPIPPLLEQRYSIARVRNRFKEIYGIDVRKQDWLYKDRRYYTHYDLIDAAGKVVYVGATLYALGKLLEDNGDYYTEEELKLKNNSQDSPDNQQQGKGGTEIWSKIRKQYNLN